MQSEYFIDNQLRFAKLFIGFNDGLVKILVEFILKHHETAKT